MLAQAHTVWHAVVYQGIVEQRQALALVKGTDERAPPRRAHMVKVYTSVQVIERAVSNAVSRSRRLLRMALVTAWSAIF